MRNEKLFRGSRQWASPPEIFWSEQTAGVALTKPLHGRNFVYRSDFPVILEMDGQVIGAAGAPAFPPWGRIDNLPGDTDGSNHVREVTFRLPVGFGGNGGRGIGGLTESELHTRHGMCVIESTDVPGHCAILQDPRHLAVHTYDFAQDAQTFPKASGLWLQDFKTVGSFEINGVLPKELYVHSIEIAARLDATQGDPTDACPRAFRWDKRDVPAGDGYMILDAVADGGAGMHSMRATFSSPAKVPLGSLYQPYAAESAQTRMLIYGTVGGAAENVDLFYSIVAAPLY